MGNVHVRVGKISFTREQLLENVHAVIEELVRAKPASSKGRYLRAVTLSSTMGPGVRIDPAQGSRRRGGAGRLGVVQFLRLDFSGLRSARADGST